LNAEDLYDGRENPTPLSSLSQIRTKKLISEQLSQLPVEQAEVLQLMYFQGQSGQQVANTLALPLGTVKSRIRLAMNKMKVALAPLADLGVLEGKI
jgi:RNA polymerase sigma-70 factor (ECF subfamily)